MNSQVTIERIVILLKLSDGTVKEMFLSEKENKLWLQSFREYYAPKPLKVINCPLNIKIE